jgi:rRNA pseudouridine-1189 N-methylase Emg1 (Nep1/Mra1 family)
MKLKWTPEGIMTESAKIEAIKAYGNTNFVNIMLEKQFYQQLEETAQRLKTKPDILIYNALLLILKRLEKDPLT